MLIISLLVTGFKIYSDENKERHSMVCSKYTGFKFNRTYSVDSATNMTSTHSFEALPFFTKIVA